MHQSEGRDTVAEMTYRDQLKHLLLERSMRFGNFTLSSGGSSTYYIDARRTTMSAEGQVLIGRVGYEIVSQSGLEPTHLGGLTMGADPISYAIAHRSHLEGHPLDGFSVRKKAKHHGTGNRVEGGLDPSSRCLVIEDTLTTGKSTLSAVEALREHGVIVVGVLTLVDRSDNAEELFREIGLPLLSFFPVKELLDQNQR
ncbi:MAG: orotate phosphoribosyltransferase [Gemmatimonadetes bacterium]|nr:orotate phosphoribosyltransferase [Gemmatimonadota bacterium]